MYMRRPVPDPPVRLAVQGYRSLTTRAMTVITILQVALAELAVIRG